MENSRSAFGTRKMAGLGGFSKARVSFLIRTHSIVKTSIGMFINPLKFPIDTMKKQIAEEASIGNVVEGINSKLTLASAYLKGRHNDAARMLIEQVSREAKECELESLLQTIEGFQAVVKHQEADGRYIRGLNEIKEASFLRGRKRKVRQFKQK